MSFYLTPAQTARPGVTPFRRAAFMAALDECTLDVQAAILGMIEGVAEMLVRERGLGKDAANNQATEFIAACVWNKATAPAASFAGG